MKIRRGFVSNSSTSNFIVIGKRFKLTENVKRLILTKLSAKKVPSDLDDFNDAFYDLDYNNQVLIDDEAGSVYVGYLIADISSEDGEFSGVDLEVEHVLEKARKTLDKIGYPDEKLKLYGGTRLS